MDREGLPTAGQARCLDRLMDPFGPDLVIVSVSLGNDFRDDQVVDRLVVDGLALTGVWARTVQASWRARLMFRSRLMMWVENNLMLAAHPLAIQPVMSSKEQEILFFLFMEPLPQVIYGEISFLMPLLMVVQLRWI